MMHQVIKSQRTDNIREQGSVLSKNAVSSDKLSFKSPFFSCCDIAFDSPTQSDTSKTDGFHDDPVSTKTDNIFELGELPINSLPQHDNTSNSISVGTSVIFLNETNKRMSSTFLAHIVFSEINCISILPIDLPLTAPTYNADSFLSNFLTLLRHACPSICRRLCLRRPSIPTIIPSFTQALSHSNTHGDHYIKNELLPLAIANALTSIPIHTLLMTENTSRRVISLSFPPPEANGGPQIISVRLSSSRSGRSFHVALVNKLEQHGIRRLESLALGLYGHLSHRWRKSTDMAGRTGANNQTSALLETVQPENGQKNNIASYLSEVQRTERVVSTRKQPSDIEISENERMVGSIVLKKISKEHGCREGKTETDKAKVIPKEAVNEKAEEVANEKVKAVANEKVKAVANKKVQAIVNEKVEGVVNEKIEGVVNEKVEGVVNEKVAVAYDKIEAVVKMEVKETTLNKKVLHEDVAVNKEGAITKKIALKREIGVNAESAMNKEVSITDPLVRAVEFSSSKTSCNADLKRPVSLDESQSFNGNIKEHIPTLTTPDTFHRIRQDLKCSLTEDVLNMTSDGESLGNVQPNPILDVNTLSFSNEELPQPEHGPKLNSLPIISALMGVGTASFLSQRNAARFSKKVQRTRSIASQTSDFSYSSLFRAMSVSDPNQRIFNKVAFSTGPFRETSSAQSVAAPWLPVKSTFGNDERKGSIASGSVIRGVQSVKSQSERRTAIDLMNRIWKPMGCAAQEVLVNEWEKRERLERDEILRDVLAHQTELLNGDEIRTEFNDPVLRAVEGDLD